VYIVPQLVRCGKPLPAKLAGVLQASHGRCSVGLLLIALGGDFFFSLISYEGKRKNLFRFFGTNNNR